jgi:electron transport complex protein RnfB
MLESVMPVDVIHLLDAELPQTQCGLCGHPAGCLPYATAMVEQHEPANKCVPGGQPVADRLAQLLGRPAQAVDPSDWPIAADGRPQRVMAYIREDECIGCTKCLDACPVDAIIGSGKLMHTVLTQDCTGCELCIPPCPVDCIDLIPTTTLPSDIAQRETANRLRQRYQAHVRRYAQRAEDRRAKRAPVLSAKLLAVAAHIPLTSSHHATHNSSPSAQAQTTDGTDHQMAPTTQHNATSTAPQDPAMMVQLATLRSQISKLQRQLKTYPDDADRLVQLNDVQQRLQALISP